MLNIREEGFCTIPFFDLSLPEPDYPDCCGPEFKKFNFTKYNVFVF